MENIKRLLGISLIIATLFIGGLLLISIPVVNAAMPYGAGVSPISNATAVLDAAQSHDAIAGNVTEMDIFGYSTTQTWQGYFGNVSGTIQLVDASDNVMYNWSLASPEGEVFASTNESVSWVNIQCFNFSATGDDSGDEEEATTRGGTSQVGMNLTQLETLFTLETDAVDGVNETFGYSGIGLDEFGTPTVALAGNDGSHDLFYVNNLQFSVGECLSTNVFRQGDGIDDYFEEVLLYDPITESVVFTALLEEGDLTGGPDVFGETEGFDARSHDFQMLVLEDGHGTDVLTTTYYFYVELE